eukprot:CFRG5866T1
MVSGCVSEDEFVDAVSENIDKVMDVHTPTVSKPLSPITSLHALSLDAAMNEVLADHGTSCKQTNINETGIDDKVAMVKDTERNIVDAEPSRSQFMQTMINTHASADNIELCRLQRRITRLLDENAALKNAQTRSEMHLNRKESDMSIAMIALEERLTESELLRKEAVALCHQQQEELQTRPTSAQLKTERTVTNFNKEKFVSMNQQILQLKSDLENLQMKEKGLQIKIQDQADILEDKELDFESRIRLLQREIKTLEGKSMQPCTECMALRQQINRLREENALLKDHLKDSSLASVSASTRRVSDSTTSSDLDSGAQSGAVKQTITTEPTSTARTTVREQGTFDHYGKNATEDITPQRSNQYYHTQRLEPITVNRTGDSSKEYIVPSKINPREIAELFADVCRQAQYNTSISSDFLSVVARSSMSCHTLDKSNVNVVRLTVSHLGSKEAVIRINYKGQNSKYSLEKKDRIAYSREIAGFEAIMMLFADRLNRLSG